MSLAQTFPSELLSEVFLIMQDRDMEELLLSADYYAGFAIGWVRTSWVCRSWRDAALTRRQLWTKFTTYQRIRNTEAIFAFLERAPDEATLHIAINCFSCDGTPDKDVSLPDAFEILQPWVVTNRIESLQLWARLENPNPLGEVNQFLGTLGPGVKRLAVDTGGALSRDYEPFTLNIHGLPNLHTLYLHCLPSGDLPLPDIPRIIISGCFEEESNRVHDFLRACPNVEILEIRNTLLWDFSAIRALPIISMPRLKLLVIDREVIEPACSTLRGLRLPPSASFELDVRSEDPNRARFQLRPNAWLRHEFLPENLDNLPVLSSTHSLTLHIDDLPLEREDEPDLAPEEPFVFYLHGRAGLGQDDEPHWSIRARYCGGIPHLANHRYLGRFLRSLPLIVQPALMVRLELHLADWLSVRKQYLWLEMFTAFPNLHTLILGGWEIIEAATRTLEAQWTLLPKLGELRLCVSHRPEHVQAGMAVPRWLAIRGAKECGVGRLAVNVWRRVAPATRRLVNGLLMQAQREAPALATEVVEGKACRMCGARRAFYPPPSGSGGGTREVEEWRWEVSSDEDDSDDDDDINGPDDPSWDIEGTILDVPSESDEWFEETEIQYWPDDY